jgi:hypothetical protein
MQRTILPEIPLRATMGGALHERGALYKGFLLRKQAQLSFSAQSRDDLDSFTDPDIARTTGVTSTWVSAGGKGEDPAVATHR